MNEVKLCYVEPGMIAVKVFKPEPVEWSEEAFERPFEALKVEEIVLPLTCEPGNTLHAALYDDTLYCWFEPGKPPTVVDQDRWQALTGLPLRF